ncbi:MAG: hypothetical protein P4M01_14400 [Acidobacteriota bacterium]|nr:hypothetical protein [Acidobacteriota bacterium]
MQTAKDTFLKALATRLATVNATRTVTVDGVTLPAVLAAENETAVPPDTLLETFVLDWQNATEALPGQGLMELSCHVSYATKGTAAMLGTDRGRILTAMDEELMEICVPQWSAEYDYSQTTPAALGRRIFWSTPALGSVKSDGQGALTRQAELTVFCFAEAN